MPVVRLGLILVPVLLVSALVWQNQTPRLALVFLGLRSQPLPLGLWLVMALVLGSTTGGLLKSLLNLNTDRLPTPQRSPSGPRPSQRPSQRQATASDWQPPASSDWGTSTADWNAPSPQPRPRPAVNRQREQRAAARSAGSPNTPPRKSVFDAEYRVVTPPDQPPPNPPEWDEFEDDFFDQD